MMGETSYGAFTRPINTGRRHHENAKRTAHRAERRTPCAKRYALSVWEPDDSGVCGARARRPAGPPAGHAEKPGDGRQGHRHVRCRHLAVFVEGLQGDVAHVAHSINAWLLLESGRLGIL